MEEPVRSASIAGAARADKRVNLVDHQDDVLLGVQNLQRSMPCCSSTSTHLDALLSMYGENMWHKCCSLAVHAASASLGMLRDPP